MPRLTTKRGIRSDIHEDIKQQRTRTYAFCRESGRGASACRQISVDSTSRLNHRGGRSRGDKSLRSCGESMSNERKPGVALFAIFGVEYWGHV